jgi:hypothetical protein
MALSYCKHDIGAMHLLSSDFYFEYELFTKL